MKIIKWVDHNGKEQENKVFETIPYSSRAAIIEEVVDSVMRNGYKPYMLPVTLRTSVYHEYTDYVVTDVDEMMAETNLWCEVLNVPNVCNEIDDIVHDVEGIIDYQKNRSGLDLIAEYLLGEARTQKQVETKDVDENESEGATPMN